MNCRRDIVTRFIHDAQQSGRKGGNSGSPQLYLNREQHKALIPSIKYALTTFTFETKMKRVVRERAEQSRQDGRERFMLEEEKDREKLISS